VHCSQMVAAIAETAAPRVDPARKAVPRRCRPDEFVDVIEDRRAVDQMLPMINPKHGHFADRIAREEGRRSRSGRRAHKGFRERSTPPQHGARMANDSFRPIAWLALHI